MSKISKLLIIRKISKIFTMQSCHAAGYVYQCTVNGLYFRNSDSSDEWSGNEYSNHNYSTRTIFVINHVTNLDNSDNSLTSMDILTVVWYFSTFLVLVAFFSIMACSDSHCGRVRKPEVPAITPPPTPAPSYREFAPPSYETVMNSLQNGVFIISVNEKSYVENSINDINTQSPSSDLSEILVHRV